MIEYTIPHPTGLPSEVRRSKRHSAREGAHYTHVVMTTGKLTYAGGKATRAISWHYSAHAAQRARDIYGRAKTGPFVIVEIMPSHMREIVPKPRKVAANAGALFALLVAVLPGCAGPSTTPPTRSGEYHAGQMLFTNTMIQQSVHPWVGGFR